MFVSTKMKSSKRLLILDPSLNLATRYSKRYLFISLSDGRTIWIDTLEFSASNAWVNTGVVIGIFSVVEFLPKMYLHLWIQLWEVEALSKLKHKHWFTQESHPATVLKPLEPDNLSPSVSTTIKGLYFLTCNYGWKI